MYDLGLNAHSVCFRCETNPNAWLLFTGTLWPFKLGFLGSTNQEPIKLYIPSPHPNQGPAPNTKKLVSYLLVLAGAFGVNRIPCRCQEGVVRYHCRSVACKSLCAKNSSNAFKCTCAIQIALLCLLFLIQAAVATWYINYCYYYSGNTKERVIRARLCFCLCPGVQTRGSFLLKVDILERLKKFACIGQTPTP